MAEGPGDAAGVPRASLVPVSGLALSLALILPGLAAVDRVLVIEGRVLDSGGRPVAGARVAVGSGATRTDADGRFRLEALPAERVLEVAADGFLPRWLTKRGHRLALSNGIIVLAVIALALILGTGAHVDELVAFYAIGVFTGFTLAGFGMARYFTTHRTGRWRVKVLVNTAVGTVAGLEGWRETCG